jgi:hypothetical protein
MMDAGALALTALLWHGSIDIAVGRGERGPWQMNESRYAYVDDPTVSIDRRGDVALAWVDQERKDVFFQKRSREGKPLGEPVNVSRSPQVLSWLPRVASNGEGTIFILWQEIIFAGGSHGGDILFARSTDGGRSFSAPENLSSSIAGDGKGRIDKDVWHNGSLDLVVDADGVIHTAWTEYEGVLWYRRSADGGKTFAPKTRVPDVKPARAPSLAVHGGTVYLAWTVGDDPAADIRVSRAFGAPVIVGKSKGYSDAPKLAVDARGSVHLVYSDEGRILYSRSKDGARSFERPRDISGRGGGFPALEVDVKGNVYVLWERFAEHPFLARGLGIALSTDGGATFKSGTVPGSAGDGWNGSLQGLLMRKLALGPDGMIAIVNSSFRENARSRVWLMRGQLQAQ